MLGLDADWLIGNFSIVFLIDVIWFDFFIYISGCVCFIAVCFLILLSADVRLIFLVLVNSASEGNGYIFPIGLHFCRKCEMVPEDFHF